jgi:hypothetical protein
LFISDPSFHVAALLDAACLAVRCPATAAGKSRSTDQGTPQVQFVADAATIDAELRLAALRRAARERGGPLPLIDVADALLDERRQLDAAI